MHCTYLTKWTPQTLGNPRTQKNHHNQGILQTQETPPSGRFHELQGLHLRQGLHCSRTTAAPQIPGAPQTSGAPQIPGTPRISDALWTTRHRVAMDLEGWWFRGLSHCPSLLKQKVPLVQIPLSPILSRSTRSTQLNDRETLIEGLMESY